MYAGKIKITSIRIVEQTNYGIYPVTCTCFHMLNTKPMVLFFIVIEN